MQIIDSLHSDILKGTKSIIEKLEQSESDMSEELNQVASEVISDLSIAQATEKATESWLDQKIGSVPLRALIDTERLDQEVEIIKDN